MLFLYAQAKQKRFEEAVQQFLEHSRTLSKEWAIYENVMDLHEKGKGRRTIFKESGLPKDYFYKINSWIHYGAKPLYYDERSLIHELHAVKGMV